MSSILVYTMLQKLTLLLIPGETIHCKKFVFCTTDCSESMFFIYDHSKEVFMLLPYIFFYSPFMLVAVHVHQLKHHLSGRGPFVRLTHSYWKPVKMVIEKQCRPRSDTT